MKQEQQTQVLITGCAGFIGSYLARALIKRGNHVVGIDNFEEYYPRKAKEFNLDLIRTCAGYPAENFDEKLLENILNKIEKNSVSKNNLSIFEKGTFEFIEGDIRDAQKLGIHIFKNHNIDKVVHLAAMAGVRTSEKIPRHYVDVNCIGTVNLLELCKQFHVQQFVFGSSSSVYGGRTNVPFKEGDNVNSTISIYAATKVFGETACYKYSAAGMKDDHPLLTTVIRIFGPVYGPLQRPYGMALQRFIRQTDHNKPMTIFGDGSMSRDCTYIDDMVDGLVLALDNEFNYEIINIGNGKPISVVHMVATVKRLMGKGKFKKVPKPSTEVPITFADITKAKILLRYEPSYIDELDFMKGVRKQIDVYQAMPDWYRWDAK